jgi:hypothetical protein
MIAGAALAAWLADRGAQQRSRDAVDAAAHIWGNHPLMTHLEARLAALPQPPDTASVLAAARAFLDREDDITALITAMIHGSRADPFFRPPLHPVSSDAQAGLLLFHHRDLSISLGLGDVELLAAKKLEAQGTGSINFTGTTGLFRFVKAGGATLSFWEAPPLDHAFVAARAGKCRFVDRRTIEDGEELVLDGRSQSFVLEHATSDVLYFHAMVRPEAAPLAAEYDSRTLAFVGASSTDEEASRVQMMVSMLRTMEREDAVPLFEAALASPHFYTRWHVMRELLALDAEAAQPHLERMAEIDPHPEVRAAARQTLDLFFADDAAAETARCRA